MKATLTKLAILMTAALTASGTATAQSLAQPMPVRAVAADGVMPAMAADPAFIVPASAYRLDGGASQGGEGCAAGCTDRGGDPANCYDESCARGPVGVWGGVEYVFTWAKGSKLPPLLTTSTPPDLPTLPESEVLFGGQQIANRMLSGGRITVGKWLDSDDELGIAARFFGIEGDRTGFNGDSNQFPVMGRPFFNVDPLVNAQDAFLAAYPNLTTGTATVATNNDLLSTEAFLRVNVDRDQCSRTDLIGGYHYTQLDNGVAVLSNSTVVGTNLPIDTRFIVYDSFSTRNEFNGGSIGIWHEQYRGRWTVSTLAKVSIGQTYQSVTINGSTQVIDPAGGSTTFPGGILAQPTNMGWHSRNKTTYVPELNFNLTRRVTDHLDFTMGYTFIYWSSMLLAGDHIDQTVNGTQFQGGTLVGPVRPAFPGFRDTDYWVQGLSLGVNWRF